MAAHVFRGASALAPDLRAPVAGPFGLPSAAGPARRVRSDATPATAPSRGPGGGGRGVLKPKRLDEVRKQHTPLTSMQKVTLTAVFDIADSPSQRLTACKKQRETSLLLSACATLTA
jgi:hypothetical protein